MRVRSFAALLLASCGGLEAGDEFGASEGASAPPHVIYLFWADGVTNPGKGYPGCGGVPPKFVCGVGPLEECQKRTQAKLDTWYKDLNVVFTYKKPVSAPYYTVAVTDHGYCGLPPQVAGIAPHTCTNNYGGGEIAYAWYKCGTDAQFCAASIAQEQAHMVGLMHVSGSTDILNASISASTSGFLDEERPVQQTGVPSQFCRSAQNSQKMMLAALGPRSAGTGGGAGGSGGGGAGGSGVGGAGGSGVGGMTGMGGTPGTGGASGMTGTGGGTGGGTEGMGGDGMGGAPGTAGMGGEGGGYSTRVGGGCRVGGTRDGSIFALAMLALAFARRLRRS